jgi:SAM-dependent methyltransferase
VTQARTRTASAPPASPSAKIHSVRDETSYRHIAPYYDWIMAHVDYDGWGRYLSRLWNKFGSDPASILELGAGTCPFASRRVFPAKARVVYTDLSPHMLSRAEPAASAPRRHRAAVNALALPFKARFQLCVMIYDALNYLMSETDLARCLSEILRVLEPGGLFIFDITTEANSRRHFEDVLDYGELEGCTYVRASRYDREARLQSNEFTFFTAAEGGLWRKRVESHQQRIYRVSKLRALARKAGFEVAGCFEGFTLRTGREASERVHFVLRKPGRPRSASKASVIG